MTETYIDNEIVRIKIYTAKCGRCDCRFEYIPYLIHSTRIGGIPRCPSCGCFTQTVTCGETR